MLIDSQTAKTAFNLGYKPYGEEIYIGTIYELEKWIRDQHEIMIDVCSFFKDYGFGHKWSIAYINECDEKITTDWILSVGENSYEKAKIGGIKAALEQIKPIGYVELF